MFLELFFCNFSLLKKYNLFRFFLFFMIFFYSCNPKPKTILGDVDYTKVDSSPYFKTCKEIDSKKRMFCFEKKVREKIIKTLQKYQKCLDDEFDENIVLFIKINKKGHFSLDSIHKTEKFDSLFVDFEDEFKKIIHKMPKVYPALKRGIPVEVQYKLPIHFISKTE